MTAEPADSTSGDVTAQKAKDDDEKASKHKKDRKGEKSAQKRDKDEKKKKRQAASERRRGDDGETWDGKRKKDGDKRKKDGDEKRKKKDRGEEASGRKRHDHGRHGHGKREARDRDEWKHKHHRDRHNRNWDHDRDRHRRHDHHRHGWDTHRRYYQYGYYGPGYYDDCGYYGPDYDGYGRDHSYYGPDACRYEYGGYRSHFLVDMSWDQVVPRSDARDAYGVANLDIDVRAGIVCFRLAYDGIDRAIGAQIHPGRPGEVGPAQVLLHVGRNGDDGCVSADPAILYEIQNDPRGYYLEVNDEEYGRAMRGQLQAPDYRRRY